MDRFVAFFDRFCTELADRAEFPNKMFGRMGPKCDKGTSANLVESCLIPAYPLIDAIKYRNQLSAPSAELKATQSKLAGRIQTAVAPSFRMEIVRDMMTQPIKNATANFADAKCRFLKLATTAIYSFVSNAASSETPERLRTLAVNSTTGGSLGIQEALMLGMGLLAACKRVGEDAEVEALMKEIMMGQLPRGPIPPTGGLGGAGGGGGSGGYRKRSSRKRSNRKTKRRHQ